MVNCLNSVSATLSLEITELVGMFEYSLIFTAAPRNLKTTNSLRQIAWVPGLIVISKCIKFSGGIEIGHRSEKG